MKNGTVFLLSTMLLWYSWGAIYECCATWIVNHSSLYSLYWNHRRFHAVCVKKCAQWKTICCKKLCAEATDHVFWFTPNTRQLNTKLISERHILFIVRHITGIVAFFFDILYTYWYGTIVLSIRYCMWRSVALDLSSILTFEPLQQLHLGI